MPKRITDTWLRANTTKRETRSAPGGLLARKGPGSVAFYLQYSVDGRLRWVHLGAYKRGAADEHGLTLKEAKAAAAAQRSQAPWVGGTSRGMHAADGT